jgi:hypothetical protein
VATINTDPSKAPKITVLLISGSFMRPFAAIADSEAYFLIDEQILCTVVLTVFKNKMH